MTNAITTTNCPELELLHRGKVRDMYAIPGHDDLLLMVATDRISAYDVIMQEPVPGKGKVLTEISLFWFNLLADVVDNHLVSANVDDFPAICHQYRDQLEGRTMLVKRSQVLPVECIVRGYISGSFWKAYTQSDDNIVCGFQLPSAMQEAQAFPEPLFTPSTKADLGLHDENISMDQMRDIVGKEQAEAMAKVSLTLYTRAAEYARSKGIIIADTKFELGLVDGKLTLVDEVLTPDSSRFWPLDSYQEGQDQPSFDKQFLRNYLSSLDWDKEPPAPDLPAEVLEKTQAKYVEVVEKLTA